MGPKKGKGKGKQPPVVAAVDTRPALKSITGAAVINEIQTDIFCADFVDRALVLITQYEKVGTMISVTRDGALDQSPENQTYSTKTLLGSEDMDLTVIARNLAVHVSVTKPILFALALQDKSPAVLAPLTELLLQYSCWLDPLVARTSDT